VTMSHNSAGFERLIIQDFDRASPQPYQPLAGKVLEQAADNFARTTQLGSDLLVGDADWVL